jgi:hypothetical protein
MSELLEFAQRSVAIKENIRTAINERGIVVDETVPFSQYPQKIKEIARDPAFYARNDLGVTEITEGTKVLLQPLEQQGGLVEKFSNALQKVNWGVLSLYPSSTTKLMCDWGHYHGECGLYSWTKEDGFNNIFTTTTDVSYYANSMYYMGLNILSKNLLKPYDCDYMTSGDKQYLWSPDGIITGNYAEHVYNNGYGIKNVYSGNWTLWKVNENGEFTEQIGQDVSGEGVGGYHNCIYVSPNGKYIVRIDDSFRLYINSEGAITRTLTEIPSLYSIVCSKNRRHILGGTSDGKYMIVNRYLQGNGDENGIHNFPAIIEISDDHQTYTEVTEFDITGLPTWYPWLQTLCVKNAQGVVRMFKYADGQWEEISIDFPDTFTSGQDGRVTLNYDGSQICVTDSSNYQTGTVYLYNLEVTANGYKAVPYTPHNFNTKSYTAYATGNITEETVEVNALLPTLDNMEYDNSIEVHPIVKPSVQPDIVIPE